jgi:hypothetical protein
MSVRDSRVVDVEVEVVEVEVVVVEEEVVDEEVVEVEEEVVGSTRVVEVLFPPKGISTHPTLKIRRQIIPENRVLRFIYIPGRNNRLRNRSLRRCLHIG